MLPTSLNLSLIVVALQTIVDSLQTMGDYGDIFLSSRLYETNLRLVSMKNVHEPQNKGFSRITRK